MTSTLLVELLERLKLISAPGQALDLGCGQGADAIALAERGFQVTAVDKNTKEISKNKKNLPITVVESNMQNFLIENDKYNIIIAINSLPFLSSKDEVYKIIEDLSKGLKQKGLLYITLFGPKDAWAKEKKNMTFIGYDEAIDFLGSLGLSPIHRLTEEGLGPVISAGIAGIKYWHIHRFLYQKL